MLLTVTAVFFVTSTALTMETPHPTYSYPLFTKKLAILQLKTATTSWVFVPKEKSQRTRNSSQGHCSDLGIVFHRLL